MANKNLFKTTDTTKASTKTVVKADTTNKAGGKAYNFDKKHCLAQIAATNCFNGTFYASAEDNLKLAKDAAMALIDDPEFIAKVAVYSRDKSYMKDMPAFLTVAIRSVSKFCPIIFLFLILGGLPEASSMNNWGSLPAIRLTSDVNLESFPPNAAPLVSFCRNFCPSSPNPNRWKSAVIFIITFADVLFNNPNPRIDFITLSELFKARSKLAPTNPVEREMLSISLAIEDI
jgi:hypothetical protein